jgi:hypothetical protein
VYETQSFSQQNSVQLPRKDVVSIVSTNIDPEIIKTL